MRNYIWRDVSLAARTKDDGLTADKATEIDTGGRWQCEKFQTSRWDRVARVIPTYVVPVSFNFLCDGFQQRRTKGTDWVHCLQICMTYASSASISLYEHGPRSSLDTIALYVFLISWWLQPCFWASNWTDIHDMDFWTRLRCLQRTVGIFCIN